MNTKGQTWTEEEKAIIRKNLNASAFDLMQYFPGRTLNAVDGALYRERQKAGHSIKPKPRSNGGAKARRHIGGNTAGIVDYDIRGSYDGF